MASTKDLKRRIVTVKNTQQTTRAMKVVSAAKLRRSQEAIFNHRPYARKIVELIDELSRTMAPSENQFPLLKKRQEFSGRPKLLLVVVTSDRGLCGGFNSTVIKTCLRWITEQARASSDVELAFIGRKGYEFFKSKKYKIGPYFQNITGHVTLRQAKQISSKLLDLFLSPDVDEIKVVYNKFKNAVSQEVVIEDFLPFSFQSSTPSSIHSSEVPLKRDYIVNPKKFDVLNELLQSNCDIQCFRILLESQAGEHGARMSAMENATKNAGEMIRKLTLQYNKQRQAGITKELLEIIAGSESQKG